MTLITVPDCEPCKEVKKVIRDNDVDVEIVEIKKKNDKYFFKEIELPTNIGFPVLFFGLDANQKPNYLIGKDGIISYLTKGYVYSPEGKTCPYLKKNCIEKKCVKFSILYKGMVPEGGCSDYFNNLLLVEILRKMK